MNYKRKKIKFKKFNLKNIKLTPIQILCSFILLFCVFYLTIFTLNRNSIKHIAFDNELVSNNYDLIIERGIDVSTWQGKVDWKKVRKAGVEFAIIRTGFGFADYEEQTDAYFHQNIKNAQKQGIKTGVYHYSHATTIAEAVEEAEFVLSLIDDYEFEYPVYYDLESDSQSHLSKKELTDIAITFLETIEEAGYTVGIYANAHWLRTKLDMNRLEKYEVWVAYYTEQNDYKGEYGLWQFSQTGEINGIKGYVDLNVSYKYYNKSK